METIQLQFKVGEDGMFQIWVLDSLKYQNLEVLMVLQPILAAEDSGKGLVQDSPESRVWSPGFFKTVLDSWEGEPLERPP